MKGGCLLPSLCGLPYLGYALPLALGHRRLPSRPCHTVAATVLLTGMPSPFLFLPLVPSPPRYDLLCLPPSFPYGGMENPCLTFVTPTLLAGDRSLADVVAHEISHSWSGNLVTNHTWNHFWLNE